MVQSPDFSYTTVLMGMWTFAEFTTGIVISCLPVIPKFFQHVGPKVSTALAFRSKPSKDSGGGASASLEPSHQARGIEKLKLPSFKHTFASIVSTDGGKEGGEEIGGRGSVLKREYEVLGEDGAVPGRDVGARQLGQVPRAGFATVREDLERGYGKL